MFGPVKHRRATTKLEREERLIEFIKRGHAASEVAEFIGVDRDYAYKLMSRTAKKHGLEFHARRVTGNRLTYGLTDESRPLRARLGDHLYKLNLNPTDTARVVGVTAKAQKQARDRPFNHDWTLSQIERLSRECGLTFREVIISAILTPEELQQVKKVQPT